MTTIWERTNTALLTLSLPLAANAYVVSTGSQLPDAYLVYFLVSAPPQQHADDVETLRSYTMQVSYYSRLGLAGMPDINGAMTAAGFTAGPLRELPFNQQTRHFALMLEFSYLEEKP